jgi:tyrosinase
MATTDARSLSRFLPAACSLVLLLAVAAAAAPQPQRKNYRDLTAQERQVFVNAVKALKNETFAQRTFNTCTYSNTYDQYDCWHKECGCGNQHDNAMFLPWHRAFLALFEQDLRRISGNATLSLPYWIWPQEFPRDLVDGSSDNGFMGGAGTPVNTGPFKDPAWKDRLGNALGRTHASRIDPITLLPAAINGLLGITFYDAPDYKDGTATQSLNGFRSRLEKAHDTAHGWIGGQAGSLQIAFADPATYLHHAYVDCLWAAWQRKYPNADHYLPKTGVPSLNINDPMPPWDGTGGQPTITPQDVLSFDGVYNKYEYSNPFECLPSGLQDHYLCYLAKAAKTPTQTVPKPVKAGIRLDDQFETNKRYDAIKYVRVCNPADKIVEGGGIYLREHPSSHLVGVELKNTSPEKENTDYSRVQHATFDQFGMLTVTAKKPTSLLVRSSKFDYGPITKCKPPDAGGVCAAKGGGCRGEGSGSCLCDATFKICRPNPIPTHPAPPGDINNYKCYKIHWNFFSKLVGGRVTVDDQFGRRKYDVLKPVELCTPVDKDGDGIVDPARHLVCYAVKATKTSPAQPKFKAHKVDVNNANLGRAFLDVEAVKELCLPAFKDVVPTTTTTTTSTTTTNPGSASGAFLETEVVVPDW